MIKLGICLLVAVITILNIGTIDCLHCDGVAGVTPTNRITMCSDKNITSRMLYLSSGPAYEDCICRVTFWQMASKVRSRVDVRNLAQVNTTCDDKVMYKSSTLIRCTGANPWYWFPVGDGMSFDFIRRVGEKTDNNNMSFCLQVFGVPGSLLNVACWDPVDATTPSVPSGQTTIKPPIQPPGGQNPVVTTTTTYFTGAVSKNTSTSEDSGGAPVGAIVGAVIGVLVLVMVVVVIFYLKSKKQKVEAE